GRTALPPRRGRAVDRCALHAPRPTAHGPPDRSRVSRRCDLASYGPASRHYGERLMKIRGVFVAGAAALVLAAPASALRWLADPPSPPPVVTVPKDFSVEATGPDGAVVPFDASATDVPDGPLTVSCTTTSGSTLSFGSHPIVCSATDSDSQTSSVGFTVQVVD